MIRARAAATAAFCSLRAAPWNAAGVCLALAVSVGGALSVGAVWDAAIARPLLYRDPGQVVQVAVEQPPGASGLGGGENLMLSEVETLREDSSAFEWIGSWVPRAYVLESGSRAEYAVAALVPPATFDALGVAPEAGRLFGPDDHAPLGSGGNPMRPEPARDIAVVSHDLWRSAFGGGKDVAGAEALLDGRPFQIVGVMPRGLVFPSSRFRLWLPASEPIGQPPGGQLTAAIAYPVVGRLRPQVSAAAASAEATSLVANSGQRTGEERVRVIPIQEGLTASLRSTLLVLRGGAWFLILVSAFSVAALRFSRVLAERRSARIRRALGAGFGDECIAAAVRIAAQAIVVVLGAVLIASLALAGMRELGKDLPFADAWRLGASSVLGGFVAALVATALVELPQLVDAVRGRRSSAIGSARGSSAARPFAFAFLTAGTAASTVVLVATVILGSSVLALREGRGGYPAAKLIQATVDFGGRGAGDTVAPEARKILLDRSVARLAALPSVRAAAYSETMPDERSGRGGSSDDGGRRAIFNERRIGPAFLSTLGIAPIAGREIVAADNPPAEPVAVVDRSFARGLGRGEPVGQITRVLGGAYRIVGVVPDVLTFPLIAGSPTIYTPYASPTGFPIPFPRAQIAVRTTAEASAELIAAVGRTLREVDPSLRALRVESVWRQRSRALGSPVLGSVVLVIFAAAGVLLSIVGGVGHVSENIAREAPSIALRQALGAEPGTLRWEVTRRTALAVAAGIAAGLGSGFLLTRVLVNRIPWVESPDPFVFLGPAALLGLTLSVAGAAVTWWGLRSNPWSVLKSL